MCENMICFFFYYNFLQLRCFCNYSVMFGVKLLLSFEDIILYFYILFRIIFTETIALDQ